MGRKRTKANRNLPVHLRARKQKSGRVFYYFDSGEKPRREIPLGSSLPEALAQWAKLHSPLPPASKPEITFAMVATKYLAEVVPSKSPQTQLDNKKELKQLLLFFDNPPAPIDAIEPLHIRQYLDLRGKVAKTRANREKALFSNIFNRARGWGFTTNPNPCTGIASFRESGRDIYIDAEVYAAVYQNSDLPLRRAMDLAYLTGQRPADVRSLRETQIKQNELHIQQAKTGTKLRLQLNDANGARNALGVLIDELVQSKPAKKVHSLHLLTSENGQPLTRDAMRYRFDQARKRAVAEVLSKTSPGDEAAAEKVAAIEEFQFRDLRAKAATDKDETDGIRSAQNQLGHTNASMTEHAISAIAAANS